MTRGSKISALAAAVVSAIVSTQAHATFTYSLQFAGTQPTGAVISTDGKTATIQGNNTASAVGTYNLQLWGIITDTAAYNFDAVWSQGAVAIGSGVGGAGAALTSGGITGATLVGPLAATGVRTGVTSEFTGDTIADWGASAGTPSSNGLKWLYWQDQNSTVMGVAGFQPSAVIAGQSQAVPGDPNSWEVLLATFTVNVLGLAAPTGLTPNQTTFSLVAPPGASGISTGATSHANGLSFYQDGVATQLNAGSAGTGVTFAVAPTANTPEPASLGVLALGGLALLARKKRA